MEEKEADCFESGDLERIEVKEEEYTVSFIYGDCLRRAVENARHLKSKKFNWSSIRWIDFVQMKRNNPTWYHDATFRNSEMGKNYNKACEEYYLRYRHYSLWEGVFFSLFMEYIARSFGEMYVLDVGCDKCRHFRSMCKGINKDVISEYTTIDKKPVSEINSELLKEYPSICHTHVETDIFTHAGTDIEYDLDLYLDLYDMVILDIEPHGKEIEVYNIIYPYLKDEHIVICKCIGYLDLYGSILANKFLDNLKKQGILYTYFGVMDMNCNLTRDVVAIVNKKGCNYKGMVNKNGLKRKYVDESYYSGELYVSEVSNEFVDNLLYLG